MPPGAFLVFFWWSLAPDLWFSLGQRNTRRVFRYTAKGFYLDWPQHILHPPGRRTTAGSNAPGAFLVFSWSLAPDSRFSPGQTNICWKRLLYHLGSCLEWPENILHPRGRRTTAGSNAPRVSLVLSVSKNTLFLHGHLPQTSGFALLNKYSSGLSLHRLGRESWVTVIYFASWREGEQRRGLMPLVFFFVDSCPRLPLFVLRNRYWSHTSASSLGLVS